MAKGKPSRAFLEALKQEKKRRGDEKPGGGFQTPEWFFQGESKPGTTSPNAPATLGGGGRKSFRFTPIHIALGAGLLCIAVIMSYLAGRQQKPPQFSAPTEAIRDEQPQSDVLDVSANRPVTAHVPTHVPVAPEASVTQSPAPSEAGRVIGMNYVIMQSFENDASAKEAADALRKAGIGCTVEKNHPYTKPEWVLVVGTTPFTGRFTSTPEYQQYIKKVMQVSDQYAGKSKWKKLAPTPYRWR